jgi:hypothetical protein
MQGFGENIRCRSLGPRAPQRRNEVEREKRSQNQKSDGYVGHDEASVSLITQALK